ncbi:ATP-binding protein [Tenacibaculum aiptasiae]|uniref:ATP-binding protein n=1 Tax=Tenacibaculum aiptasiae TaxID=426481 RepID=A0A7J5ALT9_9FLAO|nr:ATP-binding protein [Tenacibaculum aiptasiae]KAB1158561.1 ATP-binding protein [Tenacibaculum aiptasiae]
MIEKYYFKGKTYQLINQQVIEPNENVFSILVGKNGTGKSSFLEALTNEFYHQYENMRNDRLFDFNRKSIKSFFPREVIAVSTSPFDKFPLSKLHQNINGYTYLGLRDLPSANFGIAYLSKIIASLINSILNEPKQAIEISKVLDYLGYNDTIEIRFHSNTLHKMLDEILTTENLEEIFETRRFSSYRRFNKSYFFNDDETLNYDKLRHLKIVAERIKKDDLKTYFFITIDKDGLDKNFRYDYLNDDVLFLILSGFLRLRNVRLQSKEGGRTFSMKNASSGEQSIIIGILGIASKIKDNSLICIDEPELCLHPQWQERYIQILTKTFSTYRNCHFIIATHSPQIISKLSEVNSFIIDMETGITKNASEFIDHSADYQLAKIFNSPGFKNEYLSRLAFSIISKVGKSKKFDEEDISNYNIIHNQMKNLEKTDPLFSLYDLITELKVKYA